MIITKIELTKGKKVRIFIEDEYAFWLYKKDVTIYKLKESEALEKDAYHKIIEETVFYYAKAKALSLLQHMDRTEKELRMRLLREEFKEDIVERTLDYVKSFHYIDDLRYACAFIRSKQLNKSRSQIQLSLKAKGIEDDIVRLAYEELSEEDDSKNPELEAILKIVSKKCHNPNDLTHEEKMKISASLYRKGFRSENIRKVMSLDEDLF